MGDGKMISCNYKEIILRQHARMKLLNHGVYLIIVISGNFVVGLFWLETCRHRLSLSETLWLETFWPETFWTDTVQARSHTSNEAQITNHAIQT